MAVKNRLFNLLKDREVKIQRRIDITELSKETGVSRQAIYKWLSDDIKAYYPDVMEAFCRYFECELNELLEFDPPVKDKEPA